MFGGNSITAIIVGEWIPSRGMKFIQLFDSKFMHPQNIHEPSRNQARHHGEDLHRINQSSFNVHDACQSHFPRSPFHKYVSTFSLSLRFAERFSDANSGFVLSFFLFALASFCAALLQLQMVFNKLSVKSAPQSYGHDSNVLILSKLVIRKRRFFELHADHPVFNNSSSAAFRFLLLRQLCDRTLRGDRQ